MVFKTTEIPYEMKVGREVRSVNNLKQSLKDQENAFDFVILDIVHCKNFRTDETMSSRDIAITRPGTIHSS